MNFFMTPFGARKYQMVKPKNKQTIDVADVTQVTSRWPCEKLGVLNLGTPALVSSGSETLHSDIFPSILQYFQLLAVRLVVHRNYQEFSSCYPPPLETRLSYLAMKTLYSLFIYFHLLCEKFHGIHVWDHKTLVLKLNCVK